MFKEKRFIYFNVEQNIAAEVDHMTTQGRGRFGNLRKAAEEVYGKGPEAERAFQSIIDKTKKACADAVKGMTNESEIRGKVRSTADRVLRQERQSLIKKLEDRLHSVVARAGVAAKAPGEGAEAVASAVRVGDKVYRTGEAIEGLSISGGPAYLRWSRDRGYYLSRFSHESTKGHAVQFFGHDPRKVGRALANEIRSEVMRAEQIKEQREHAKRVEQMRAREAEALAKATKEYTDVADRSLAGQTRRVEGLVKESFDALPPDMQTIARRHGITPKRLTDSIMGRARRAIHTRLAEVAKSTDEILKTDTRLNMDRLVAEEVDKAVRAEVRSHNGLIHMPNSMASSAPRPARTVLMGTERAREGLTVGGSRIHPGDMIEGYKYQGRPVRLDHIEGYGYRATQVRPDGKPGRSVMLGDTPAEAQRNIARELAQDVTPPPTPRAPARKPAAKPPVEEASASVPKAPRRVPPRTVPEPKSAAKPAAAPKAPAAAAAKTVTEGAETATRFASEAELMKAFRAGERVTVADFEAFGWGLREAKNLRSGAMLNVMTKAGRVLKVGKKVLTFASKLAIPAAIVLDALLIGYDVYTGWGVLKDHAKHIRSWKRATNRPNPDEVFWSDYVTFQQVDRKHAADIGERGAERATEDVEKEKTFFRKASAALSYGNRTVQEIQHLGALLAKSPKSVWEYLSPRDIGKAVGEEIAGEIDAAAAKGMMRERLHKMASRLTGFSAELAGMSTKASSKTVEVVTNALELIANDAIITGNTGVSNPIRISNGFNYVRIARTILNTDPAKPKPGTSGGGGAGGNRRTAS